MRFLDQFRKTEVLRIICPSCQGSGFADYASVSCEVCHGVKQVYIRISPRQLWKLLRSREARRES